MKQQVAIQQKMLSLSETHLTIIFLVINDVATQPPPFKDLKLKTK